MMDQDQHQHQHRGVADVLEERLFQTAMLRFRDDGYEQTTLGSIAHQCGATLDELYARFPQKESFIVRLYEQLAFDLESRVTELPVGPVAERFRQMMHYKLRAVRAHRSLLQHLLPVMVDPTNRLGVLGPQTNRIRVRVQAIFEVIVICASNAPSSEADAQQLIHWLYAGHLGLVFLALQPQADETTIAEGIELLADLVQVLQTIRKPIVQFLASRLMQLAGLKSRVEFTERADRLVASLLHPASDRVHFSLAENILRDLFRFRRLQSGNEKCGREPCRECLLLHLPRVEAMIARGEPIKLVLPAFPAKSPNLQKVTGALPDFGEELALRFLQDRCDAIREIYPAGAELTICSDGRVFSDVVGVSDDDVTAYRLQLKEMIDRRGLRSLSVFDLDDVNPQSSYDDMRTWLVEKYAESVEEIRQRTIDHAHHQELFNGIHRFMFEDLAECERALSRTQCKKLSKQRAYEVIQRSNAWSRLLGTVFPDALRLSIHPQAAHSEKIGILLVESDDVWLTPWHGVALLRADRFVLTRRANATSMGAKLVEKDGRPSHYEALDGLR